MKQPMIQGRTRHLDTLREYKAPLKLPGCDPAMQDLTLTLDAGFLTPDNKVLIFDRDREIVVGKPGDGQGDAIAIGARLLDIVRWISVGTSFGRSLNQLVKLFEPQQKGV